MDIIIKNISYFLKETKNIIKTNMVSSIFSFVCTVFIFFFLTMVISGWWISSRVVETIKGEAEINVYYFEKLDKENIKTLIDKIKNIEGVINVDSISENEAYSRMEKILGKDAKVLEYFDENPFSPFLEIKIDLSKIESVIKSLNSINGVEYIRDNRSVLDKLKNISDVFILLGFLVLIVTVISTIVMMSHIIRQGIYNNKEQISTLNLLGAPESFIAIPYLIEGLLLSMGGGAIAVTLAIFSLKNIYARVAGPIPFIPLPPIYELVPDLIIWVMSISTFLGIAGSLFGISSSKDR